MNNASTTQSNRGGKRANAGRKTGTGKFGEATEVLRVPASQKPVIVDFLAAYQHKQQLEDVIDISSLMLPALNQKRSIFRCLIQKYQQASLRQPMIMSKKIRS